MLVWELNRIMSGRSEAECEVCRVLGAWLGQKRKSSAFSHLPSGPGAILPAYSHNVLTLSPAGETMQFSENKWNFKAGNLVLIYCSLSVWLWSLSPSEPQLLCTETLIPRSLFIMQIKVTREWSLRYSCKGNHTKHKTCHLKSVHIACVIYFRWAKVKSLVIPRVATGWKKEGSAPQREAPMVNRIGGQFGSYLSSWKTPFKLAIPRCATRGSQALSKRTYKAAMLVAKDGKSYVFQWDWFNKLAEL